ncbi:hypothetical protein pipiens_007901 [Culex pipiens pipiens]|uniref:Uncharacterized protein n=1 Tax=Culex pipiens pipiens TaxID=38569 RepID=A0ABD1DJC5_CULPP
MKVTFFLLLVAAVAFLAVFQPAVQAAPQDIATAEVAEPAAAAETVTDGKPEGGAAASGSSSLEQGKFQANKEKGAKGQANKGKGQGNGKN